MIPQPCDCAEGKAGPQLEGNLTPFGWNSLWILWGCCIGKSWSTAPTWTCCSFSPRQRFLKLRAPQREENVQIKPTGKEPVQCQLQNGTASIKELCEHCLTPAPGSNNQWESPLTAIQSIKNQLQLILLTLVLMNSGGWSNQWWTIFLDKELICLKPLVTFVVL